MKQLKFSMISASCTGKSTTAKKIAEICDLVYVDEAAADHIKKGETFNEFDLYTEQYQREEKGLEISKENDLNGIITCSDLRLCSLYIIYLEPYNYQEFYDLVKHNPRIYNQSFFVKIDPLIPMEDNGARYLGEEAEVMRWSIQAMIEMFLHDKNIVIIKGDINTRIKKISDIVKLYQKAVKK